jgi:hypothetical protein
MPSGRRSLRGANPAILRIDEWLKPTEAVRKRRTCMITPRQHARDRLGQPLPRCARPRGLMDFIDVVSKVARQMRVATRRARFIAQE